MGISGLLPLLKEIQVNGHVSHFTGKRLAVDAYVWLHKGAFGCAEDLVKGKKTTKFVDYAMYRVRMLRHHGIEPYVVFDGGPLPAKQGTEDSRAKSRAANLARAVSFESQGRLKEAREAYTKCLDITPEMAFQLIKALRAEDVEYVVAPYEADAQLCFLEREGYVDGIITEDSDLLVFGCKLVVYKLDINGQCVWISRDKLATVSAFPMHGWTDVQFRRMAMLSGCDYLDSIQGMGLKTAHKLLRRFKTIEKVLQHILMEGSMRVPGNYMTDFAQAELAFIHQRIFHPALKRLTPLSTFPEGGLQEDDEKWIGLDVEMDIAQGIARGDLHPETRLPIEDQWPEYEPARLGKPVGRPVLGEISRANDARPMDAFVSRTKRPLHKPVGAARSGPSRLSEQSFIAKAFQPTPAGNAQGMSPIKGKLSKFFSGPARGRRSEAVVEVVDLVWEESDPAGPEVDFDQPRAGPSRSRSRSWTPEAEARVQSQASEPVDDHVPSPSPIPSSLRMDTSLPDECSKPKPDQTSPLPPQLSSPVASSSLEDDPFSPERVGRRAASPASPSRSISRPASVLVASTSQIAPASERLPSSQLVSTPPVRRDRQGRPLSRISSVLVPASSPRLQLGSTRRKAGKTKQASSDSVEDDEIVVTPSFEGLKRAAEEDADTVDRQREERARIVAAGWKQKYAFNSELQLSSPVMGSKPRSVRTASAPSGTAADSAWPARQSIPRLQPLQERSVNVDVKLAEDVGAQTTRAPLAKHARSSSPSGGSVGALSKYRFSGRVSLPQSSVAFGM